VIAVAADPSRRRRFELVDGPLPERSPSVRGAKAPAIPLPAPLVVTVCTVVLLVVAIVVSGRPGGGAVPGPGPGPAPTPASTSVIRPSTTCDLAHDGCRIVQTARWRARTAAILRARLDPDNLYFTGYSYSVTSLYNTGPRLNALGLEVYRLEGGGGTEVFVQIAKSRADAVRCGTITHHRCISQRFMDGNRFSLTATTMVADGIEVQHIPAGTYVITLVARNTTAGRPLTLTTGDLIEIAQDPRLRPPPD
jgi:hypothetical protein